MTNFFLPLVAAALAALLGFGAHRANLCTVKAVAELMTTRRAYLLGAFARMGIWVILISVLMRSVSVPRAGEDPSWALTSLALAGGVIFGLGATLNAGCVLSTLTGVADGGLGYALTLLGIAVGVLAHALAAPAFTTTPAEPFFTLEALAASWPIMALFALLALGELIRLWRGRPRGLSLRARLALPVYRLSTAAALVGVANAFLYYLYGNWLFTGALTDNARAATGPAPAPDPLLGFLFAAMLAGMIASSLQRGSFAIRPPGSAGAAVRHLLGGALMGWGVGMIPGGNATLVLHYSPLGSPHGLPAFLAMLAGIAAALYLAPLLGMARPQVSCGGDICRMDADSISP